MPARQVFMHGSVHCSPVPTLLRAMVGCGVFGLAGCVSYDAKPIDAPTTQAAWDARTLDNPGLRAWLTQGGHAIPGAWNLDTLFLAACYYNPDLAIARAELIASEAGQTTARARPNPSFNFTPGYNQDAGGAPPWILGYGLNLPLELYGQRGRRVAAGELQHTITLNDLASSVWNVRHAVQQALIAVEAAETEAAWWSEQTPRLGAAAELEELQASTGEISGYAATQTRLTLGQAEIAARQTARTHASALGQLAEAIGVPVAALNGITFNYAGLLPDSAPLNITEARIWAAQNRADIQAGLARYEISQLALQAEIAAQYPDITLGPGYQLDQGEGKWALSLDLTLPLFHRNAGPIAEAEARREATAAAFIALQSHVLAAVDRATAELKAAQAELVQLAGLARDRLRQQSTLRAQREVGEISRLELLRGQLELADIMRAELAARQGAELALAAFEAAVQRPRPTPSSLH